MTCPFPIKVSAKGFLPIIKVSIGHKNEMSFKLR